MKQTSSRSMNQGQSAKGNWSAKNSAGGLSLVLSLAVLGGLGVVACGVAADSEPPRDVQATVSRLQDWQTLVGEWRGVGQPRRGSTRDAWQETSEARWSLQKSPVGIVWTVEGGRLWQSALITPGVSQPDEPARLELRARISDDEQRLYRGTVDKGRWVLETTPSHADDEVHRLTITWLNADRLVVLAEKRSAQQTFFQRVAEVASQRQGTRLAAKDGSGPECVVTGGLGTIAVTHEGRTYYVCCTGCRDAFQQDPAGILKDWEDRRRKAAGS